MRINGTLCCTRTWNLARALDSQVELARALGGGYDAESTAREGASLAAAAAR